jgi:hypothetical protein
MSYVLVGILLLLIASGFIAYLVMTATKRSSPATADDSAVDAPGIGADDSPLGTTEQHAAPAADGSGDGPVSGPTEPGRFQRDPVGGEAEARPFTEAS